MVAGDRSAVLGAAIPGLGGSGLLTWLDGPLPCRTCTVPGTYRASPWNMLSIPSEKGRL